MKEILLRGSFDYALVDEEDYEMLSQFLWAKTSRGYATTFGRNGLPNTQKLMHRLILNAVEGQIVDHIDGNRLNNSRQNLRFVTAAENRFNRHKSASQVTSSRYKGVCKYRGISRDMWTATIYAHKREYYLGRFRTEIEAAQAYNAAASELHGPYACLNVIDT